MLTGIDEKASVGRCIQAIDLDDPNLDLSFQILKIKMRQIWSPLQRLNRCRDDGERCLVCGRSFAVITQVKLAG